MNKKRLIEYIGCAAVILALFGFLYFDYNRPENKAKRAVRSVYESKYDAVLSKIDGATPAYIVDQLRPSWKLLPGDGLPEIMRVVPFMLYHNVLTYVAPEVATSKRIFETFMRISIIRIEPKDINLPVIQELIQGTDYEISNTDSGTYLGISHSTSTLKEDVGGTHEIP
ncbi:hypothetical protein ADMFC3_00390 [Geovibrio sp. ADMFC3]